MKGIDMVNPTGGNTGGSNVTQMRGKQFSYDEVKGMATAFLYSTGTLTGSGNVWKLNFDKDVEGLDLNRTYASVDEAVDAVIPIFYGNYQAIIKKAA
jgi:hypothetical protein